MRSITILSFLTIALLCALTRMISGIFPITSLLAVALGIWAIVKRDRLFPGIHSPGLRLFSAIVLMNIACIGVLLASSMARSSVIMESASAFLLLNMVIWTISISTKKRNLIRDRPTEFILMYLRMALVLVFMVR